MTSPLKITLIIGLITLLAAGAYIFWSINRTVNDYYFPTPMATAETLKTAIVEEDWIAAKNCFTEEFQDFYSKDITKEDFYHTYYWTGGKATHLDQLFDAPPVIRKNAVFKIEEETDNTAVVGIYYGGRQENKESVLKEISLIKENGLWKINDLYGRMEYELLKKENVTSPHLLITLQPWTGWSKEQPSAEEYSLVLDASMIGKNILEKVSDEYLYGASIKLLSFDKEELEFETGGFYEEETHSLKLGEEQEFTTHTRDEGLTVILRYKNAHASVEGIRNTRCFTPERFEKTVQNIRDNDGEIVQEDIKVTLWNEGSWESNNKKSLRFSEKDWTIGHITLENDKISVNGTAKYPSDNENQQQKIEEIFCVLQLAENNKNPSEQTPCVLNIEDPKMGTEMGTLLLNENNILEIQKLEPEYAERIEEEVKRLNEADSIMLWASDDIITVTKAHPYYKEAILGELQESGYRPTITCTDEAISKEQSIIIDMNFIEAKNILYKYNAQETYLDAMDISFELSNGALLMITYGSDDNHTISAMEICLNPELPKAERRWIDIQAIDLETHTFSTREEGEMIHVTATVKDAKECNSEDLFEDGSFRCYHDIVLSIQDPKDFLGEDFYLRVDKTFLNSGDIVSFRIKKEKLLNNEKPIWSGNIQDLKVVSKNTDEELMITKEGFSKKEVVIPEGKSGQLCDSIIEMGHIDRKDFSNGEEKNKLYTTYRPMGLLKHVDLVDGRQNFKFGGCLWSVGINEEEGNVTFKKTSNQESDADNYVIFPNSHSVTEEEVNLTQSLLNNLLVEHKDKLQPLESYKFQFTEDTNELSEKVIHVNAFCSEHENWRDQPILVLDGGNCYFSLEINLTTQEISDFMVNGEA